MTAFINLKNVTLDIPVYGAKSRSARSMALLLGGRIAKNRNSNITIIRALDAVNLDIPSGTRLGIVGDNGSGKTTLLKVLAGIYSPSSGKIETEGEVSSLFDPSLGLDMEADGMENLRLLAQYRGMKKQQIDEIIDEVADFSGLGQYLSLPVRTYSAGMLVRLTFCVATAFAPDILLMDEWLSAGDEGFRAKASARMQSFVSKARILVIASHSDQLIREVCNRAIWIHRGKIMIDGDVEEVLNQRRIFLETGDSL